MVDDDDGGATSSGGVEEPHHVFRILGNEAVAILDVLPRSREGRSLHRVSKLGEGHEVSDKRLEVEDGTTESSSRLTSVVK